MSLQAVESEQTKTVVGDNHKRVIDKASEGLIFDTLQKTQYTQPIESTVRELATNCVDSQREKEIALKILNNEAKVEDFFIEREGDKYVHSKFNLDYYDKNHLDQDNNRVKIIYKTANKGNGFVDQIIFRDYGVGLGMPRLEGYFNLGYSSKRNTKALLGAFGLGNKVALSTGVEYYTIVSVHNGKKFKFRCYSRSIQCGIPKMDMEKEVINDYVEFSSGFKAYYEKTDEKNYTEVVVPTKRFNKSKFTNAVQSQLLYFDNIDFEIRNYNDLEDVTKIESAYHPDELNQNTLTSKFQRTSQQIRATVLHKSNHLVISSNRIYGKPHIVIVRDVEESDSTGVCYGNVNFNELEMETLNGSVGFRCPIHSVLEKPDGSHEVIQEGVNVTPSRESVIWDDQTKEYIKKVISKARDEASNLISDSLKNIDNIFQWKEKFNELVRNNSYYSNTKLGKLSGIIDTSKVDAKFKGTAITVAKISDYSSAQVKRNFSLNSNTENINRSDMHVGFSRVLAISNSNHPVFSKDYYLCKDHSTFNFLVLPDLETSRTNLINLISSTIQQEHFEGGSKLLKEVENPLQTTLYSLISRKKEVALLKATCALGEFSIPKVTVKDMIIKFIGDVKDEETGKISKQVDESLIEDYIDREIFTVAFNKFYTNTYNEFKNYLSNTKKYDKIINYNEFKVSEEQEKALKELEKKQEETEEIQKMSAAEIRKLNNEMLFHLPNSKTPYRISEDSFQYSSISIKVNPLNEEDNKEALKNLVDKINASYRYFPNNYKDPDYSAKKDVKFIYGFNNHKTELYKIFADIIQSSINSELNTSYIVIKIAKNQEKYIKNNESFIHVEDFFFDDTRTSFEVTRQDEEETTLIHKIENTNILNDFLMRLLTVKYIRPLLSSTHLNATLIKEINPDLGQICQDLQTYYNDHSRTSVTLHDEEDFYKSMQEFQIEYIKLTERLSLEEISKEEFEEEYNELKEEFSSINIMGGAFGLDFDIVRKFRKLEEFIEDNTFLTMVQAASVYIENVSNRDEAIKTLGEGLKDFADSRGINSINVKHLLKTTIV